LVSDYGFNDGYLLLLAQAAQTFVKKMYPVYFEPDYETVFEGMYPGLEFPFTCTQMPWNDDTQTYWTTDEPGSTNAMCSLNEDFYCGSQDNLNNFYYLFMGTQYSTNDEDLATLQNYLYSLDVDTQCEVAKIFVQRAGFDGEMAGSGAAMDPLFWVAHGAVERLLQKVIFQNNTRDLVYNADGAHCTGHTNDVRSLIYVHNTFAFRLITILCLLLFTGHEVLVNRIPFRGRQRRCAGCHECRIHEHSEPSVR
jgi:hypothetical protein